MDVVEDTVFLLDVDNTLIDNDQFVSDLRARLNGNFGNVVANRYWGIFETLRNTLGYADYIGALQQFRLVAEDQSSGDALLLDVASFLIDYPFAERLFPGALDVVARLNSLGRAVILSDGEIVFQGRKVQRSGLWEVTGGRVLIYVHKEQMLDSVRRIYPARRYVMVDDKLRVLAAMKTLLGDRLTTIFPRQGHYARDPQNLAAYPPADIRVERIGDLLSMDKRALLGTL